MRAHASLPPRRWWLALLPALGCLACSGNGGLHPVRGKVLHKDLAAQGALVTFHLKGADPVTAIRPVGLAGPDGTFTLTTGGQEGAPAGAYVVTLVWPEEVAPKGKGRFSTEAPEVRDRLRGAYADPATSTFTVEITQGANAVEPFHLK
jgi:hypothetical protein